MSHVLEKLDRTKVLDPNSYVAGLRDNLKAVTETVAEQLRADHATKSARAERKAGLHQSVEVGDKVFLQKPPSSLAPGQSGASRRLQSKLYDQLFEVKKKLSATTVVLQDPDTGSTELGFGQPVNVQRLVPYDLRNLEAPVAGGPLHLEVRTDSGWERAELTHQSATGTVLLDFASRPALSGYYNLEAEEYRWLS